MFDDNNAVDFTLQESVQEHGIVAEGYASIRLSVGTEHVRMCEHPIATKHVAAADRCETKGTNAVKTLLAQREVIDIRGRWSATLCVHITRIVHVAAQAGMRFQPAAVGQIYRVCGNGIARRAAGGAAGRTC